MVSQIGRDERQPPAESPRNERALCVLSPQQINVFQQSADDQTDDRKAKRRVLIVQLLYLAFAHFVNVTVTDANDSRHSFLRWRENADFTKYRARLYEFIKFGNFHRGAEQIIHSVGFVAFVEQNFASFYRTVRHKG